MVVDDSKPHHLLDPDDMLRHIDGLPDQIEMAWKHAQSLPMPKVADVTKVLICGMGGSAIGGSLLKTLLASTCAVPIISQRDYALPAFVDSETLVIGASHSGNTEETIAAFGEAQRRGAQLVSFSTGGLLADLSSDLGGTHWPFYYAGQPRAAIGYSLMMPLALLSRLGLVRNHASDVAEAVELLRQQQIMFQRESLSRANPAERLASCIHDRFLIMYAAEPMLPVARRWRGQISENAKAWAQYEELPEMTHNFVAGLERPKFLVGNTLVLFLESSLTHPRNQRRAELCRQMFQQTGYSTDVISARGEGLLSQMLSMLHYGDYTSYYLAIDYGVDPTPVDAIEWFKTQLAQYS